jgi:hypothetical protein
LSVCFPTDGVEPREEGPFDAAFVGDANHVG